MADTEDPRFVTESERAARRDPERLEAFSDGVMAVIITLMAFDLQAPLGGSLQALGKRLPALLVYLLSFTIVGIYWNNHHHLLRATQRIDGAVMWANLHLLFWLSLLPVLTEWMGHYYRSNLPAAAWGVAAIGAGIAYGVLERAIIRANGSDSLVAQAIGSDFKGNTTVALYAVGIGLAFITPWISYGLYVAVAVLWFIPDRRLASSVAPPGSVPPS